MPRRRHERTICARIRPNTSRLRHYRIDISIGFPLEMPELNFNTFDENQFKLLPRTHTQSLCRRISRRNYNPDRCRIDF